MQYRFSFPNRVSRFAEIEFTVDGLNTEEVEVRLPAWRPGRYELGDFAKNIRSWRAADKQGQPLPSKKISKDRWLVQLNGSDSLTVRYEYYCSKPDAGSCWIDEQLVYINPVHCCLFLPERLHEPCKVILDLPDDYSVACSMQSPLHGVFEAASFHELVDSPWMASADLHHGKYTAGGTDFHIWMHGNVQPDWEKMIPDFRAFTDVQLKVMGSIPVSDFHFLILALPYPFYHGVEHLRSTVLAIGPAGALMQSPLYDELTGVASHELFHVWNIKTIRPSEMLPYDYSAENYSRLGFVYEGVTTYYGDLFLSRAGVYSREKYFKEIDLRLKKHFDSHARFHLPVADASFDTWLDGYVPGIPHRKTSIYDEGSLVALMTDLIIRRSTGDKASLDTVMRILYDDFGKQKIGYTEADYITIVEEVAGIPLAEFFVDYVYGTENFEPLINELLEYVGCELVRTPSENPGERRFGFRVSCENGVTRVTAVLPGSIADRAGLGKDDEIIAVNEQKVEENLSALISSDDSVDEVLTVMTPMKRLKDIVLKAAPASYFQVYNVRPIPNPTAEQLASREAWLS